MRKLILITVAILGILFTVNCQQASGNRKNKMMMNNPKTLSEVQQYAIGEWQSLSVELRPAEDPGRNWYRKSNVPAQKF